MITKRIIGKLLLFFSLLATVFLANYSIKNWGTICETESGPCLIPIFPHIFEAGWILAPSGVLFIGFGFFLRDLVQRYLGIKLTVTSIVLGAILSALINPYLALASGLAFFVSEMMDLFVYTPLQERHLFLAVIASNFVGLVVDSILFLLVAFRSLQFVEGQIIGKALMILPALLLIAFVRWLERRYQKQTVYQVL